MNNDFHIDMSLLNTIVICSSCKHQMLAIDVAVVGDNEGIACPLCMGRATALKEPAEREA